MTVIVFQLVDPLVKVSGGSKCKPSLTLFNLFWSGLAAFWNPSKTYLCRKRHILVFTADENKEV